MPPSSRSTARGPSKSSPASSADVSFSHSRRLSVPRDGSSPSSWSRFCSEVTMLALSRYSIAIALGEDVDASISSAYDLADPLLTQRERDMYATWKKGKAPPRADWRKVGASLKDATSAQRARWSELTEALRVLYGDGAISKENCKGWVEKYDDLMPLLNACKKVEIARQDARPAKAGSSKLRRDVREIIACRQIIGEIGKQRVRSNTTMKQINKDASDRELDLSKRLAKVNLDIPRDRESAAAMFEARESYFKKLTKTRMERLELAAEVGRQNVEINVAEELLKARIAGIEYHLRRMKS